MTPPIVGASDELLAHHIAQRPCDSGPLVVHCPCEQTVVIFCDHCGWPLFLFVKPGTFCEHAEWLMQGVVS